MVLGRWVVRLLSFQAGWCSSRAVCPVSRSRSPGMLQRTGADVGSGVDLAYDAFSSTPVPSSGPPRRASRGAEVGVEAGEGAAWGTGAGRGRAGTRRGVIVSWRGPRRAACG